MVFAQSSLAILLGITATSGGMSEAANLRQVPRILQTYQKSSDYISAMLDRVNQERAAVGLSALCSNKKLLSSAQRHSDDMAAKDYMEHDGSDGSTMSERITQAGYDWSAVAENVAAGQADVDAVMDAWMNSPEHKVNILGDYTMLGTAYAYKKGNTYEHFWTQDFGSGDKEVCDSTPSTDSYNQDQVDQSAVETPVPKTAVHVTETPQTDPPCPNEEVTEAPKSAAPCPEEGATDTPVQETTTAPAIQGYKSFIQGIFG